MLVADIFGVDRRPVLAKLNKPTLVLASSVSPLLDMQKEMAATIPGSKFAVVEGAGHRFLSMNPRSSMRFWEHFSNPYLISSTRQRRSAWLARGRRIGGTGGKCHRSTTIRSKFPSETSLEASW